MSTVTDSVFERHESERQPRPTHPVKRAMKQLVYGVAMLLVFPLAACEWLARRIAGRDVFFAGQGELISLVPGKVGHILRNSYYHLTMKRCPLNCLFGFGTVFTHSEAEIGERVAIGARCNIGMVRMGDDAMLSDHIQIVSGRRQHTFTHPGVRYQDQVQIFSQVYIGRNAWIGSGVVIMADIGDDAVIGAGAVVVKPIPAASVAVGNPARVLRSLVDTASPST